MKREMKGLYLMKNTILSEGLLDHTHNKAALRYVRLLVSCYLGLSVLTLVVAFFLRDNTALVPPAVWVRGTIVVLSALLTALFVRQMARGSRSGYLRLRIVSAVMVIAIVIITALPGLFPLWMRIEQGVCGLLLLGVVLIINQKHLRQAFARR